MRPGQAALAVWAGGTLLAIWRNGLCRRRLTLRRQRLVSMQRRRRSCGARPRHAPCPWRRRGSRGRRCGNRGAWNLRRQRIHGKDRYRGWASAWPRHRLTRQTAEQRVGDRCNPRGVGRLALGRRHAFEFTADGNSPSGRSRADHHYPRSGKLRHHDPRAILTTSVMPSGHPIDGALVTTACGLGNETELPHGSHRRCGRRRDICPPPRYRARRAHLR